MKTSVEEIRRLAGETGFRAEFVEKVFALLGLLEAIMGHPFLGDKLALKGGAALNLFFLRVPRLSVDIDFNYTGAIDRDSMLADRTAAETAIDAVCQRLGMAVRRQPTEHAGGKWSIKYQSSLTPSGNLELDLNYLYRVPLWPPSMMDSVALAGRKVRRIRTLDLHEIAAGKLCALFARKAARDVFDAVQLLGDPRIELERLRLGFVVYGAMSRWDWREVSPDDISPDPRQFASEVAGLLRTEERIMPHSIIAECRELLQERVLPLRGNEVEFLARMNEKGIISPQLLTDDPAMQERLLTHPALIWKASNVRQHRA